MNNLTKYLIIDSLHNMWLLCDAGTIDDASFDRFVRAACESLPDEPYIVECLTDFLNDRYELSNTLERFMIAIARDENLDPAFGG